MARLFTRLAVTILCLGALAGNAIAKPYPVAPAGTYVTLQPDDFIQSVPLYSDTIPPDSPSGPYTLIGDNFYNHPGPIWLYQPAFIVGVIGHPILANNPDAAVYLWESTGGGLSGDSWPGPGIRLGYWDGTAFTPYGDEVQAVYRDTNVPLSPDFYLTSSVTPLSDFHIVGTPLLNVVMVESIDGAHNQVAAVAVSVPEPSGWMLLAGGLAALISKRSRRLPASDSAR